MHLGFCACLHEEFFHKKFKKKGDSVTRVEKTNVFHGVITQSYAPWWEITGNLGSSFPDKCLCLEGNYRILDFGGKVLSFCTGIIHW